MKRITARMLDMVGVLNSRGAGIAIVTLLAIVIFVYQPVNYGFAAGHHGILSAHGATLATNLSLGNCGFMYDHVTMESDGSVIRSGYNRFPATYFAMLKVSFLMAGQDLHRQFLYGRRLTSLFCAAAFICAFLSLRLLCNSSLPALCATLLAFSSLYIYYYSDMMFNDIPALFGCLLVFHGIIVHEKAQRTGQLYVKTLAGTIMGWQPLCVAAAYGLLFVVMSIRRRCF